jgi:ADP-ribose pyrophosphatase YjhB (NUDIX family)
MMHDPIPDPDTSGPAGDSAPESETHGRSGDPIPESNNPNLQWLRWAKALQALAQTGLHFSKNEYDTQRYEEVTRIAAEMMAAQGGAAPERVLELFRRDTGYATPKIDARGVVFREGKILLVREVMDGGRWTLPGGWADVNASPAENVVREIREESGFETRTVKLLAVFDRSKHPHLPPFPHHVYKLFFLCEITGGEARTSVETSEVAFFGESEIPELSITRVTPCQIARFFDHARHPDWPTDFD